MHPFAFIIPGIRAATWRATAQRAPYFKGLLVIVVMVLTSSLLPGQPCLTDRIVERNLLRFPEMKTIRAELQQRIENNTVSIGERSVITIPVVVHVVYKSNLENISLEQILSQIDVLNADYRLQNTNANTIPPLFTPLAADVNLEFCLAQQDPAGNPTDGITRRETSWINIGQLYAPDGRPRIHYTELGGEDTWDPEHYLNIWVCSIGGGILGFGTMPGTAPPAEDGVVIDPRFFGDTGLAQFYPPHHLGRTATHEIGHYFNLRHIWGGNSDSCNDDDDVADTPVQRSAYVGCPAFPQFSCGNSAMFMNYMDYTDDACMALFTIGQKNRMWAALNAVRPGLLNSNACIITPVQEKKPNYTLRLYPNPANHFLIVETDAAHPEPLILTITDSAGKVLYSNEYVETDQSIQININPFPNGFYVLSLTGGSSTYSRFFIKAY